MQVNFCCDSMFTKNESNFVDQECPLEQTEEKLWTKFPDPMSESFLIRANTAKSYNNCQSCLSPVKTPLKSDKVKDQASNIHPLVFSVAQNFFNSAQKWLKSSKS